MRPRNGDRKGLVRGLCVLLWCLLAMVFIAAAPIGTLAAGEVCQIDGVTYETLGEALAAVTDGETIRLLADIDYESGILINGKAITFDLNNHTLEVVNSSGTGLHAANDAVVFLEGTGEFNVTGKTRGVHAEHGASVAVTNAHATFADGIGVFADTGAMARVDGNATASGDRSLGAYAQDRSRIYVAGDAQGNQYGAVCYGESSQVLVGGDVIATDAAGSGALAADGGWIIINGEILSAGAYIRFDSIIPIDKDRDDYEGTPMLFDNYYRAYTDGESPASTVLVRFRPVCEIGIARYETLGEALAAVADGETIRLLEDIYYENGITIEGINITFNLNGHILDVVNLAEREAGLSVTNGTVSLVGLDGPAAFNVTGTEFGVFVRGPSAEAAATVTNATSLGDSVSDENAGAYATSGGDITIIGNAAAEAAYGYGAYAGGTGSSVTVGGDVVAGGEDGCGAFAFAGGEITIDGKIAAEIYIKAGSTDKGIDDYEDATTKEGYRTYTDGESPANTVWVKEAAPGTPANLQVTSRTSSRISLAWDASIDDMGVAHYVVEMKGESGPWAEIGTPTGTSLRKTGLDSSTEYFFRVKAVDVTGLESEWSAELSATTRSSGGSGGDTAPLAIDAANPADGVAGTAYAHTFTASGGNPAYTFKVTKGSLPPGLSLNQNGIVGGIPTAAGSFKYTITVTDSSGATSSREFTHLIKAGAATPAALHGLSVSLTVGSTAAIVDGRPYTLDAAPYIEAAAGRTMTPLRFIGEGLGARVEWKAETSQVMIKDGDMEIVLTVGSAIVQVNGEEQTMDCAAVLLPPGRVFVPLRFVSEILGAQVDYNQANQQITITR